MAVIIIFLLGIANFAMNKAVMSSQHPMVMTVRHGMFGRYAPQTFLGIEFFVLLAALGFASAGSTLALFVYAGYTALNGLSAWAVLSGRM